MKRIAVSGLSLLLLLLNGTFPVLADTEKPEETEETEEKNTGKDEIETEKEEQEEKYDYRGSLNGVLNADSSEVFVAKQNITSSSSPQCILSARNGGMLIADNMILQKSGDGTREDRDKDYGINSMTAAVNAKSLLQITNTDMSSMSAESPVIFAADGATVYAKKLGISATGTGADGLRTAFGGTIFGDSLKVTAGGDDAAALVIGKGGGTVSLADSELYTHGSGAPLIRVNGLLELNGVSGTATGSPIASVKEGSTVRMDHVRFTSTWKNTLEFAGIAYAIEITGKDSKPAVVQIQNSTITSSIDSGAVISVVNTPVSLILSDSDFSYNTANAALLHIAGEKAQVSVTAVNETMQGTIQAYDGASLDLYLTEGSVYGGVLEAEAGAKEETLPQMRVFMDSSSVWIVNSDCEVGSLYMEEGAMVTDEEDRLVTIYADGKRVVYGNSEYVLHVKDEFARKADLSKAGRLSKFSVDRSRFEESVKEKENEQDDPVPVPPDPEDTHTISNGNVSGMIAGTCVMILAVITMIIRKK